MFGKMKAPRQARQEREVEILSISVHGVWISVEGVEYFLPFEEYPRFRNARISEIHRVRFRDGRLLHWPELAVDLDLERLQVEETGAPVCG